MKMADVKAWLRQDTTVNGIGLVVGAVAGSVAQAVTHETTWSVAVGGIAAAVVHLVAPGNAAEAASASKLATDLVTAAVQKRLAAALPELLGDGVALVETATPAAAPPAAPHT